MDLIGKGLLVELEGEETFVKVSVCPEGDLLGTTEAGQTVRIVLFQHFETDCCDLCRTLPCVTMVPADPQPGCRVDYGEPDEEEGEAD